MDITPAIFPFFLFSFFLFFIYLFFFSLLRRGARINGRRGQKVHGNVNDFCTPLFRSNGQTSFMFNDEKPMIVPSFLEWSLYGEWSGVSSLSELAGSTLLVPRYLGQRKYFVMRGQVFFRPSSHLA